MKKDIDKIVKYIDGYVNDVCENLPTADEISIAAEYNEASDVKRSEFDQELIKRLHDKIKRYTKAIDYQEIKSIIYMNKQETLDFLNAVEVNANEKFYVSYNVREEFSVNATILDKIGSLKDLIKFYAQKEKREKIGFTNGKLNDHFCNLINFNFLEQKVVLEITPVNFREAVLFSASSLFSSVGPFGMSKTGLNKKEKNMLKSIINDDAYIIHDKALPVLDLVNEYLTKKR